ncbi:GMC family oxidoreductase [filamentous cyanobacterium CCT1]|nr:GMC family oxidoreductase [filamentous cyanobacterium CCT1]
MLIDSLELPRNHLVKADFCVIGSGPGGIAITRELAGTGKNVCLLESGGVEREIDVQDLSAGESIGDPLLSLRDTRNRQFGGNSNIWSIKTGRLESNQWNIGVRYVPLSDIDFQVRDWIPDSGWPIVGEELIPYYKQAQKVAHSGPFEYRTEFWANQDIVPYEFEENAPFTSRVYQFGPAKVFHQNYFEELKITANVEVYLHATAIELVQEPEHSRVCRVHVSNLAQKTFSVEAKIFILATGGIETARLLLASNSHQPAGIGNSHDLVGRYFMEHPLVDIGRLYPSSAQVYRKTAFYDLRCVKGHPVMGHFVLTPEAMAKYYLPNGAVVIFPRPSIRQTEAVLSLKTLFEQGHLKHPVPKQWASIAQHLLKIGKGLDYIAHAIYLAKKYDQSLMHGFGRGGWSQHLHLCERFRSFEVLLVSEQVPIFSNRVQLSKERDVLGMPRAALHWQWGQQSIESTAKIQHLFAQTVEQHGLGQMVPKLREGQPFLNGPAGIAHHIGTTRMSAHPSRGVVDENCRVHSTQNLYVASSAVFPTGGYANPTLTILALSLRLASHLKTRIE